MDPIRIEDLLGRDRYGANRDAIRRRIVEYKRGRRVSVGPHCTFVFEDRTTVWYQIQEMLWVEHTTDLDAIRDELVVYNAMLPKSDELSATLLITIDRPSDVADVLHRLVGIDACVRLEVAGVTPAGAQFEPDRQSAQRVSAVQYVRFPVSPALRTRVVEGAPMEIAIDHPNHRARAVIPDPVRASLLAEIVGGEAMETGFREVRDVG